MNHLLRAFADSNVRFSAAHRLPNRFEGIWQLPGVEILLSEYVIGEVTRNLHRPDARARLWQLIYKSHLVPDGMDTLLPVGITLPAKDEPILKAALESRADVLITGDFNHFGLYVGMQIDCLRIESPNMFRSRYPEHFPEKSVL